MRVVTKKIPSSVEGKARGWRFYERKEPWEPSEYRHLGTVYNRDGSWILELEETAVTMGVDSPQTAEKIIRENC